MASTSETIANNVLLIPESVNETVRNFRQVHNESTVTVNQTEAIVPSDYELDEVQDRVGSLEEDWVDEWNYVQNPASTVYDSIAAIVVVIAVVGGYVTWRRR